MNEPNWPADMSLADLELYELLREREVSAAEETMEKAMLKFLAELPKKLRVEDVIALLEARVVERALKRPDPKDRPKLVIGPEDRGPVNPPQHVNSKCTPRFILTDNTRGNDGRG